MRSTGTNWSLCCSNKQIRTRQPRALADHAQQAGSRDNITCIVVDLFR